MKIKIINFKKDYIANVIVVHLVLMSCKNMLVSTSATINTFNPVLNSIIFGLLIVLYTGMFIFSSLKSKIRPEVLVLLVFILIFITVSSFFDPKILFGTVFPYSYVRKQIFIFIEYSLPLFLGFACLDDLSEVEVKLYKSVYIMFFFATIAVWLYKSVGNNLNEYSMPYGNAVLLNGMLLLFKFKKERKAIDIVLFFVTIGYVLMAGSRGPLLCYAIAFVVVLLDEFSFREKMIMGIFVGIVVICLFIFREEVFYLLYNIFLIIGFKSRSLLMFAEGNYVYDGGRGELHQQILNQLKNHPIVGLGAFGGGKIVGLPHGIYIDVLANFGFFFGIAYMFIMLIFSYRIIRKSEGKFRNLYLMFFLMMFIRGFYEESFWMSKELWILMGLIISDKYCLGCQKIEEI